MSSRGRYFRLALFAPLAGPVLGVPFLAIIDYAPSLSVVGLLLIGSGAYAWSSYLVLAVAVLVWAHGRDDEQMERAARFLPLVYAPLAGLQEALDVGGSTWSDFAWPDFFFVAGLATCFGYAYAFVILLGSERFATDAPERTDRVSNSVRAGT